MNSKPNIATPAVVPAAMPDPTDTHAPSLAIGLVQLPCTANLQSNLDATVEQIRVAANRGARLVCLQELFSSLYFCQSENHDHFSLAQSIPGPITERLRQLAKELSIVIVAGVFERRAAGLFHNTAAVIEADGTLLGLYRKMHIPDDPYFYEKFYFTPGDLGFKCFETSVGKIGVCICWDQWFPEAARLTAMAGAEILIYPTAIGWLAEEKQQWGESQVSAWETMMRSHAIANGVYLVAPNRVGHEEAIQFWGRSFVADPYGNVLQRASDQTAETLVVECDLKTVETARTFWPFLRDRRIDAYGGLTKRWIDEPRQ